MTRDDALRIGLSFAKQHGIDTSHGYEFRFVEGRHLLAGIMMETQWVLDIAQHSPDGFLDQIPVLIRIKDKDGSAAFIETL